MKFLDNIELPAGIKSLQVNELKSLAAEIRDFLIASVSKTGGHLSSSLGVVELSVVLHHVFDSPQDKIVWDVGHQSYAHKILTGRKDHMHTLRQKGGISGFTKRAESVHDVFGAGHSSTSISAALGMAVAMQGNDTHAIAVIGDGALTGGMAFEALNHAGAMDANLLVVLNDNEMSISENVGAMSRYLGRILASRSYSSMREHSRKILSKIPKMWDLARKAEEHFKGMVVPGTLFEELGFHYIGPIDGHDIETLLKALNIMKSLKGPQLLHIITKKGKGFDPAEQDPVSYHGVTVAAKPANAATSYTKVFSAWINKAATTNENLVAITPAMSEGSGLIEFSERYSDRFYDVGIAEQHALTFAAGLACEGVLPVVAIYSTFLQRAYDQLIHDIALQNLPVIFAIDRAGIVGADGPTHAGIFDLSFLRIVPNMVVMTPKDGAELTAMLDFSLGCSGPVAIRYPRGDAVHFTDKASPIEQGKAEVLLEGNKKLAILAFGSMVLPAVTVGKNLEATVVNMRFVKPLDTELILKIAQTHNAILTVEENVIAGGAGEAISQVLSDSDVVCENLGLPDEFVEHGNARLLLAELGLDATGIETAAKEFL